MTFTSCHPFANASAAEPGQLTVLVGSAGTGRDIRVLPLKSYEGRQQCAVVDLVDDPGGVSSRATVQVNPDCGYVAVLLTNPDFLGPSINISVDVIFGDQTNHAISNGLLRLGVNPEGHLIVPGFDPSSGEGTTFVGLRYLPTNADALAPGCACEGWGVADLRSRVSGWGNEARGGTHNLHRFYSEYSQSRALTSVEVGPAGREVLFVSHWFRPITATPNLYEIQVTIRNRTSVARGNLNRIHATYRRVMDWDAEPTAFDEYVTIQATGASPPAEVLFTSNDGFAHPDPLVSPTDLGATGLFTDYGPKDHGALIDFDFGMLNPGQSVTFTMYYGGAGSHTEAMAAINAVGADLYSLAKPITAGNPASRAPNTFIWAYRSGQTSTMTAHADDEAAPMRQAVTSTPGVNRQNGTP